MTKTTALTYQNLSLPAFMTDCWKYRHISLSMETKNQGTDQQVSNVRETGDGGVDRCVCMHKDTLDMHTVFFKKGRS